MREILEVALETSLQVDQRMNLASVGVPNTNAIRLVGALDGHPRLTLFPESHVPELPFVCDNLLGPRSPTDWRRQRWSLVDNRSVTEHIWGQREELGDLRNLRYVSATRAIPGASHLHKYVTAAQ